jgi:beta-barrel assembly-enhancing protease
MRSMSAPSEDLPGADAGIRPWHYDGRNGNRWRPLILLEGAGFRLSGEGWDSGPYVWADLVALSDPAGRAVYGLKREPGWRLGFDGPPPRELLPYLPAASRYGGIFDRFGLAQAATACAVAAAVILFIGLKAPGWIAPHIPRSWEDKLGDAMIGDFGGRICGTPQGIDALDRLKAKIDPDRMARTIEVANIPMVNAITLPGGRIIIFDGLLQQAKSGDEVAGVLGHEIGHVEHRDTMAALVRQLGLSVVLGGFNGNVGGYVNGLLSLSYGRDAEAAADSVSIDRMRAADISPADTAGFFDRMGGGARTAGKAAQAMTWLSSHPLSESRRAAFANSAQKGHVYAPVLDAGQWQALKGMCAGDPKVEKGFPQLF